MRIKHYISDAHSSGRGKSTRLPENLTYLFRYCNFLSLLFILFVFAGNLDAQTSSQTFNSSGTFAVPAGVTNVTVECWGGGGAGGGASGGSTHSGGGGGGGAYNKGIVAVVAGNSYPVTVGAGGTGVSGANGNPGGTSSFNGLISANGGRGGSFSSSSTNSNGGPRGAGGSGGLYSGGAGGDGISATPYSGGGGGGAGNSSNGNNATGSTAGTGGSSFGGSGGSGINGSTNGNPGLTLGGGGSGGNRINGSGVTASGGNGGAGRVIITWTACTPFTANISAQYCARPGYIRLTANGGGPGAIYLWSTGESTNPIDINIAGQYSVTITNSDGCTASAIYNVSTELVVNGDFSAGNTGFTHSTYIYEPDIAGNSELVPEGTYGIGTDPQAYHTNFWGRDHTTGTGNFMIVNGFPGAPQPVVWSETVPVVPGTSYYFSAWATSLNSSGNYATLQFRVNNTLVGTTAPLPARAQNNNPPYDWVQFYGTWTAPAGVVSVPIEIVDFQTAATGNDFGLDDISFATLVPMPMMISLTPAISICAGATLDLSPTLAGGKSPLVYSWTGPNGFTSNLSNPSIPNVTAANSGAYQISVTDGYGCPAVIATTNVTVNTLSATFTQSNVLCNGTSTGSVVITPSGGTLPYTITPAQTGLAAGLHIFTITDANGCSTTVNATITQPAVLTVAASGTNVNCFGASTGSATATPLGGTSPYTYSWNTTPVQTTVTASNLSAGIYTVTVTDSKGCTASASYTVTQPAAALTATFTQNNVICHDATNGSVLITPSGGAGPYTITPAQTNLAAGSYTFTVKDANNCTFNVPATITFLDNLPPVFIGTLPADKTVECNAVPAAETLTATDNFGTSNVTFSEIRVNGTCPNSYSLKRTWTATDACGLITSYTRTITVVDTTPPVFTSSDKEYCVASISVAIIDEPTVDLETGDRSEWYVFKSGSTDLDISGMSDNCSSVSNLSVRWKIDFANGTSLNGNGQVSTYGSDIRLDGAANANVNHHITYWLTDQCGNEAQKQYIITIHPRPEIIKQTL